MPKSLKDQVEQAAAERKVSRTGARSVQKTVPIDRIDRDPDQPRKHFDPVELAELAASMSKLGQLQPVTVRYIASTRRYKLVMGERRWRAARDAGLTEMHCVVLHGVADDDPETLAKAIAENCGRADMTPIEEADAFQRLVDADYTIEDIAEMVGKSSWTVEQRLGLRKLVLPLQEALAKGHVPIGVIWYVQELSADNQHAFLARWARGEFKTSSDAEAFARACRHAEQQTAEQGGFFVLDDRSDQIRELAGGPRAVQSDLGDAVTLSNDYVERHRITTERVKLVARIDRLRGAGDILTDLAATDAEDLAVLLSGAPGGIGGYRDRLTHFGQVLAKASKQLQAAQAIAAVQAGAIQIDPEAAAAHS